MASSHPKQAPVKAENPFNWEQRLSLPQSKEIQQEWLKKPSYTRYSKSAKSHYLGIIKGQADNIYAIYNIDEKKNYERGKGSQGAVKVAKCLNSEKLYALKTILLKTDLVQEYAEREHQILNKLNRTPEPIIYRDSKKHGCRKANILMDFAEGISLRKYLIQEKDLTEKDRVKIVRSILTAYSELIKKQIIHCDLSPSNILYNPTTKKAAIIDFGLAYELHHPDQKIKRPMGIGTCGYKAPEGTSKGIYSRQTDIFALGILFHEIMFGLVPYNETSELVRSYKEYIFPEYNDAKYNIIKMMINAEKRPSILQVYEEFFPEQSLKNYIATKKALEKSCCRFCLFFSNYQSKIIAASKLLSLFENKAVEFDATDIAMLNAKGSRLSKILPKVELFFPGRITLNPHIARSEAFRMVKGELA